MEQEFDNKLYMNGQEVILKNPGTKGLADFLKLARAMSRMPKDADGAKFMEYMDDNAIESTVKLINLTLEKTFPTLDKDERESWGMQNAMLILPKVVEMCSPKRISNDEERKQKLLEKITNAQ